MSRHFRVEIGIKDFTEGALTTLESEGLYISEDWPGVSHHWVGAETSLVGGEDCEEAHQRYEKALGVQLNTRWVCLDYVNWDVEIYRLDDE